MKLYVLTATQSSFKLLEAEIDQKLKTQIEVEIETGHDSYQSADFAWMKALHVQNNVVINYNGIVFFDGVVLYKQHNLLCQGNQLLVQDAKTLDLIIFKQTK